MDEQINSIMAAEKYATGLFSQGRGPIREDFKRRIRSAYKFSCGHTLGGELSPIWSMISDKNSDIHSELVSDSANLDCLDEPGRNYLLYGFDNLFKDFTESLLNSEDTRRAVVQVYVRELRTLAEAVGAQRVFNPEGGSRFPDRQRPGTPQIDDLLTRIEEKVGYQLDFPNPYADEFGIASKRGIISQRALPAIYQALRIKRLSEKHGRKVLEIGAGLGRTAYYAHRFGVTDYTIVDLPMTNVAQAAFLGSTLGEQTVALAGEQGKGAIRIRTPDWLASNREEFDIFFNADSLTEMNKATMQSYVSRFMETGSVFYSINHEANDDRVCDFPEMSKVQSIRLPYWLRAGYVEEVFENSARLSVVRG